MAKRVDLSDTIKRAERGCPFAHIALATLAQTKPQARKSKRRAKK